MYVLFAYSVYIYVRVCACVAVHFSVHRYEILVSGL